MEDAFGALDVFERLLAVVEEPAGRQAFMHQMGGDGGHEHLAAVSGRKQARDAIDGRTEVVRVALVCRARVNRHSDVQSIDVREIRGGESPLRREGRGCGVLRPCKGDAERVPDRLEDPPGVRRDRLAHHEILALDGSLHRRTIAIPAVRAAFDVREEKRHGA